jgi:hypothetical protein
MRSPCWIAACKRPIGPCCPDAVLSILAPFARKIMPLFAKGRLRGVRAPSAKTAVAGAIHCFDWISRLNVAVSLTLAEVWTLKPQMSGFALADEPQF